MNKASIIRKTSIILEDTYRSLTSLQDLGSVVLIRDEQPVGLTNTDGQLAYPLIIVQFPDDEEIPKMLAIVQDLFFKNPYVPSIIAVSETGNLEGVIERSFVANDYNAFLERDFIKSPAGVSNNVPLVVYQCPKGDYEFIPYSGPPDRLCPTHNLKLTPKRIVINV